MLSTDDLAQIRTIVHEELARSRRHRARHARVVEPDDPWLDRLRVAPPVPREGTGRAYVTQTDVLLSLGLDPAAWGALHAARVAAVLRALGYQRGPRRRADNRRSTPYYLPSTAHPSK